MSWVQHRSTSPFPELQIAPRSLKPQTHKSGEKGRMFRRFTEEQPIIVFSNKTRATDAHRQPDTYWLLTVLVFQGPQPLQQSFSIKLLMSHYALMLSFHLPVLLVLSLVSRCHCKAFQQQSELSNIRASLNAPSVHWTLLALKPLNAHCEQATAKCISHWYQLREAAACSVLH